MQTIVAGTDFTKSSINACAYAAMLADKYKCRLVLFNLHDVSWIHANSGLFLMDMYRTKRKNEQKAKKQLEKLKTLFPELEINTFVSSGSFKKEIKTFTQHHQVKLIVMGLAEKNHFYKKVYGSHGVDIAGKLEAPVIIVPEQFKTHTLNHLVLAVDNNEKLHQSSLKEFESLIKTCKPKVDVLHCRTKEELFEPIKKIVKLNKVNYNIEVVPAKSLEKGIREFNLERLIDLVVIISRKHSLFYNLFAESNTHSIALDSKVPVMAIHE
jgi:nucleotide-binding universal stress UspA family protein